MIEAELRDRILSKPDAVLSDRAVMRALIGANDRALGSNVIDMRGAAMGRLEAELDRLKGTHETVIAAAYENVAGTKAVHRAALLLLDAPDFVSFVAALGGDVAAALKVDAVRLVLESREEEVAPVLGALGTELVVAEPGFVDFYLAKNGTRRDRRVTLRPIVPGEGGLYGTASAQMGSEALIRLDLGPARLPAMLALGAHGSDQFRLGQGTDLLDFLGGVAERAIARLLA
jgi:hypothetical protein